MMERLAILSVFTLLSVIQFAEGRIREEEFFNTSYLLDKISLPSESHELVTEDGYVISLWRIPRRNAPVALFVHGFWGSSDHWVSGGRDRNIATILYDNGYDIWLLNERGNVNSKRHLRMDSAFTNKNYWDFSFHEIAIYDLPPTIDYVIQRTGQSQINYVGHSMAAAIYMTLRSERPQYVNKIRSAVLLAPVAYSLGNTVKSQFRQSLIRMFLSPKLSSMDSIVQRLPIFDFPLRFPVQLVIPLNHLLSLILTTFGFYELPPMSVAVKMLPFISEFCETNGALCRLFVRAITVSNIDSYHPTDVMEFAMRAVGGTSVKTYEHLTTCMTPGQQFGQFDYGPEMNFKRYGSVTPPRYAPERARAVPTLAFYSNKDPFLDETSMNTFAKNLKLFTKIHVPDSNFEHFDYLVSPLATKHCLGHILKFLRKHNGPFLSERPQYQRQLQQPQQQRRHPPPKPKHKAPPPRATPARNWFAVFLN